jgi:proteasome lid subunit RPN8/RPN11
MQTHFLGDLAQPHALVLDAREAPGDRAQRQDVALAQDQPHVAVLHTLPVHQPRPRRTHLRELALQRLAEPDVVVLCSAGLDVRAVVLLRCRRHREHRGLFPIARHELEGALASDPVSCFSFSFRFFTGGWGPS